VQHPLAVETEGRGAAGDRAVAVVVADLQVGTSLFAFRISSTIRPMIPVMSKSLEVKTAATPAALSCSA
jgi:hypothetical protein